MVLQVVVCAKWCGSFTRAILVSASIHSTGCYSYLLVQEGIFHYRMHVALIRVFTQESLYYKNLSCCLSLSLSSVCVGEHSVLSRDVFRNRQVWPLRRRLSTKSDSVKEVCTCNLTSIYRTAALQTVCFVLLIILWGFADHMPNARSVNTEFH